MPITRDEFDYAEIGALRSALRNEMHAWSARVEEQMKREAPVDTGHLRRAIGTNIHKQGDTLTAELGVITPVSYAETVHNRKRAYRTPGTKGYFVTDPLQKWLPVLNRTIAKTLRSVLNR